MLALELVGAIACAACCAKEGCAATVCVAQMVTLQSAANAKTEMWTARRSTEIACGEREIPVFNLTPGGNFDPNDNFKPDSM